MSCAVYVGNGIYIDDVTIHLHYDVSGVHEQVAAEIKQNVRKKTYQGNYYGGNANKTGANTNAGPTQTNRNNSNGKTSVGKGEHSRSGGNRQPLSIINGKNGNAQRNLMGLRQNRKS